jgi:hypothetical protein
MSLLGVGLFQVCVPAYLILQVFMAYRYTHGWRIAALVPLFFAVPLVLFVLYAFGSGSSIWPMTLILFTPVGLAYLAIMFAVHRFG